MTSATSADDKISPPPSHRTGRLRQVLPLSASAFCPHPASPPALPHAGDKQTEIRGMHIRIAKKQAEYSVHQPGKMHIQLGILKIMRAVKMSPVGIFGGCHPGKHGAPVRPPHLSRQSEGKIQLAVEDFPAEKSSSVSALFFATSVISVST
ncbi:Uncharacterised protein [Escherichia coli]|uniref:Uncharacterized protein n=1 Tax=Escherichia coli TaxID=562 RepID=A0AB38H5B3_ECOLX|nr:Uncharacterised protein [Escherichia coli]